MYMDKFTYKYTGLDSGNWGNKRVGELRKSRNYKQGN